MPEIDEQVEPSPQDSWGFDEGTEFAPGRFALRKLGGGYDYEAYLTWDDKLYALVVAKCLRPHLVDDTHALNGMRREADHLLNLKHPVVVRGFDAVIEGECPHLVMEHLEGPNLASLVRRYGPLPLEQLLPLSLQVCSAIHYLGTEEIVHLDVKPRNIIMGAPPRLIDLSIARSFARAKRITGHVGTDAYMAPEQCDPSRATIGPAADVWGLGATLYHAVTGHVPFPRPDYNGERDKDNDEVRFPQLSQPAESIDPKKVPMQVIEPIMECLAPDPAARPRVTEVVGRLEPLVAELPTKPVLRRMRPGRRR
ncbi:MAG: serine/threonine protein kinase [Actinomycetota bacterium]|nr:serine/threonine protein kinase [Actinomycetota bacterium]